MPKNKSQRRAKTPARVTMAVQTLYGRHLCDFIADSDGKGFTVIAKHVPGVVTEGKNLREAERMAREALELYIEALVQERSAPRPAFRPRSRALAGARA